MKQLRSTEFPGTFIGTLSELLFQQENEFHFSFIICKETFATIPIVMYFRKNFHLIGKINEVISELESRGLIEYWDNFYLNMRLGTSRKGPREPTTMTLSHIIGCFQVFLGGCFIAWLCFIIELIVSKCKKRAQLQKPGISKIY